MLKQQILKWSFGSLAMLSAVLIWSVGALAQPPMGIEGNVTVQNDVNNPVPVEITNDSLSISVSTEYRFAGYSDETTDGDAGGILGMHARCQNSFGEMARMCTTKEFWMSPQAVGSAGEAWIHPVYVMSVPTSLGITPATLVTDWTGAGVAFPNDDSNSLPSCIQYTSVAAGTRGWFVGSDGRVGHDPCAGERQVTCCVPAN